MRMLRLEWRSRVRACVLVLLAGCTLGKAELAVDASSPALPPDASQGEAPGDGGGEPAAPDASPLDDAGTLDGTDAAQSFICKCEHGSCASDGACVCDPGFLGELCDAYAFVGTGRDGDLVVSAPL